MVPSCAQCRNRGYDWFCGECYGCEACCQCGSREWWLPVFEGFDDHKE